ncbi:MAG: HU family DNA-binding protein [Aquificae bacterium]|nr:HU family DNA-binding protein [Aquificota bacterium]
MTRERLAKLIENKTGIEKEIVKKILDTLGEAITEGLKEELEEASAPRVLIPNLGTFILKQDKRAKSGFKLDFRASAVIRKDLLMRV